MGLRMVDPYRYVPAVAGVVCGLSIPAHANIDGSITQAEYGTPVVIQDSPALYTPINTESHQQNELNAVFASMNQDGDLSLGLTGHLAASAGFPFGTDAFGGTVTSNGIVMFIDSRAGGGVASTDGSGNGTLGSLDGQLAAGFGSSSLSSTWGNPVPASTFDAGFNPDFAIEIYVVDADIVAQGGGLDPVVISEGSYTINVVDLTLANGSTGALTNLFKFPTSTTTGSTTFTPSGASTIPSGSVSVGISNNVATNTPPLDGVVRFVDNDSSGIDDTVEAGTYQANIGTGAVGDPLTDETGFEFLLSSEFLGNDGQDVRIAVMLVNGGGSHMSNQILGDVGRAGGTSIGGSRGVGDPGAPAGGKPLFDAPSLTGDQFFTLVMSGLTGDLDGDGFVGIADLNIVLGNWNQNVAPGDPLLGDPSGDGFVGIEDLNTVLGNWNAGTPPAASVVPEPASLVAVSTTCLALLCRRCRKH